MGSKRIQEKNNEKETVIIDEVTRITVEDVRQVVESDSQVRSRDTGEPIQKRRGFAAAPKPSGPVVYNCCDRGNGYWIVVCLINIIHHDCRR